MNILRLLLLATPALAWTPVVFESLHSVPDGWHELPAHVNPKHLLSLRLHMHLPELPELRKRLEDVSSPSNALYGEHLDEHNMRSFLSAPAAGVSVVKSWLQDSGITITGADADYITFTATVAEAEKLLDAEYKQYRNAEDEPEGQTVLRTLGYSIPKELRQYVALVQPTTMFGLRPMRATFRPLTAESRVPAPMRVGIDASGRRKQVADNCNRTVTLDCLADLYGFRGYVPNCEGDSTIGVSGFLEQWAQHDDLTDFLTEFRPEAAADGNFSFTGVPNHGTVGVNNQGDSVPLGNIIEANLDIQYTVGITYPLKNTYFSTAGRPPYIPDLDVTENDSEPYLAYLSYLLSLPNAKLPGVLTTSYGESEQTVPLSYRLRVCDLFGALGARGVSVLFSSGDSGPGWSCRANDGTRAKKFLPVFPAACPWVTAVGGTVGVRPERAIYFSSGGFSDTWKAPSYQRKALHKYFANHKASYGSWLPYFNRTGRGFPDVAAQGEAFQVMLKGNIYSIGGTSASAPAFAAIVALLNDARGKRLGFLNPLLYENPSAFTDIVDGRSTGCDGMRFGDPIAPDNSTGGIGPAGVIKGAGWDAVKGWDPVTGLGTPLFRKLRGVCSG